LTVCATLPACVFLRLAVDEAGELDDAIVRLHLDVACLRILALDQRRVDLRRDARVVDDWPVDDASVLTMRLFLDRLDALDAFRDRLGLGLLLVRIDKSIQ
jgi:hypothetical protein